MSLSIALEQIQRPTWWVIEASNPMTGSKVQESTIARRNQVREHLKSKQGQRVITNDLLEVTGASRTQIKETMNYLLSQGEVQQYPVYIRSQKHLGWRLVKNAT